MKAYVFAIFCMGCLTSFAQGINFERGLNNTYNQGMTGVVTDEVNTYYGVQQNQQNSFFSTSRIHCTDTNGVNQWETFLNIQVEYIDFEDTLLLSAENTIISDMALFEDDELFIWGELMLACDVMDGRRWFLQKMQTDGVLLWNQYWHMENDFPMSTTGTIFRSVQLLDADSYVLTFSAEDSSTLVFMAGDGTISDSLELPFGELIETFSMNDSTLISYNLNTVYSITNGNQFVELSIANPIQNVLVQNDSVFVLTDQGVLLYDAALGLLNMTTGLSYSNLSLLKSMNGNIFCLSDGPVNDYLLTFDDDLNLIGEKVLGNHFGIYKQKDFSETHIACGENFNLSEKQSVRVRDFSLTSETDAFVNRTDAELLDLNVYQTSADLIDALGFMYQLQCSAKALVKNVGTNPLNRVVLNHMINPWGICNQEYYCQEFTGLNIAPGESMWIDLGSLGSSMRQGSSVDGAPVGMDICVYSSNPNGIVDLNVSNDNLCKYKVFGYVGMEENKLENLSIYPNPVNDVLQIEGMEVLSGSSYQILASNGQLIREGSLSTNQLSLGALEAGLYFLVIDDGQRANSVKFIKAD